MAVAEFLREGPGLRFDYASNVTGVDWLDAVVKKTIKVKQSSTALKRMWTQRRREEAGYLEPFIIFIRWS